MMIMTRRWSPPALAGLALGTVLLVGCASAATSDPPASAPTSPSPSPAPLATVNGDELEPRGVPLSTRERENATAQRLPMKGFKPPDWPTRGAPERATGIGGGSPVPGAVPAVGAALVPAVFAERRASEALDRLAGLVTIRREKRGAVITLASDKLVDSGQWALTSSGQYSLRELAAGLRDQDGRMILIQGYTDSMGTSAVNDALSLRRAEAVRDYLATQGVSAESMRAEGLGAKRPVAHNGTSDGRAQNRRIEIVIVPAP
ncbi:MAG TPA: OmpA family protein [Polyangiaceae bacterium]|nr:OmpA family protein [Polyangiaceae bacterium]